jgi:hypothetical protein
MLCSAFSREGKSVFVELLTYADLELMKARKLGAQGTGVAHGDGALGERRMASAGAGTSTSTSTSTSMSTSRNAHKRYVILTYQVSFLRPL